MNILIIAKHLNPGGISSYIASLAKGLKQRGNLVFVASSGGALESNLKKEGVEIINLDLDTKSELSPKVIFAVKKLLPIIKEKNIQIIHAQTRVASVVGFWLSKFTGIAYITTCHGFFKPRLFRRIFPLWGKKVIAISDAVYGHLIKDFNLKPQGIELIYNGLEVKNNQPSNESKREFKDQFGLNGFPIVGCVARLSEVKGHKFLIEAFKIVLEDFPTAQLMLVGEGKIGPDLIAQVKGLGIERSVVFIPSQIETFLVLSLMDIFVMASVQEGLGLAIMEAMASGIPVVATNVGGIKDLIKHNENGILVEAGNSGALANAIISLLNDKDKAKALSLSAQNLIQNQFSLDKMVSKTQAIYKSVLND